MDVETIGMIFAIIIWALIILGVVVATVFAFIYWLKVDYLKHQYIKNLRSEGRDDVVAAIQEFNRLSIPLKDLFKKDGVKE